MEDKLLDVLFPLLHWKSYGEIPPVGATVAVPFTKPLQVMLVIFKLGTIAVGELMPTLKLNCPPPPGPKQLLLSFTVKV